MKRAVSATLVLVLAVICMLAGCLMADAHSGRTDAKGGHYDRSTGEYHYHHGYPAHQHPNGVCPYENDVETNIGDTAKSSSAKSEEGKTPFWQYILSALLGLFLGAAFIGAFLVGILNEIADESKPSIGGIVL